MPISIPAFTTTASISGNTLIADTDNQLNLFMSDAKTYVETTYNTVATSLEGNVGIHVTTAKEYSDAALASSNIATQSKNAAASSANQANSSSLSATASAQTATDKAYAASLSAIAANQSATDAATSATTATTKASEAIDSAIVSTTQANISTAKASEAIDSAIVSTTQANISTAKASEASASANQALTSRNQAETFAQQAQASALSVDANNIVHRAGDENIAGVKTFVKSPIVPTPTTDTQAVNKVYVDSQIDAIPETDLTNYYNKTEVDAIALDKVDKVSGKQLSTEDYTTAEKTKLSGLSNYIKPVSEPISYIDGLQTALDTKVDKVSKQALDSNSALRVTGTTVSLYKGDGTFDSITTQDTIYTLPTATSTVKGGIEIFSDTVQTTTANAVSTSAGRTYGIQLNSAGQAVVNVPWSDTNTVYTHPNSGVTAGTYSKVTVDAQGHITAGASLSESDIPNLDASKITTGTIDAARLPSFVDDVLEFANLAGFPTTGETGKIYIALDTNKTYRWSGSTYVYITSGAVDSVAGKTGIVTLVKGDVGLGNVDNTSDLNKPISTATQTALNLKVDKVSGKGLSTEDYTTAEKTKLTGLSNYTKPVSEPISYITGLQTALDTKVDKVNGKQLSTEDYTTAEKTKLSGIESGAQVNTVTSVVGKTGIVTLVKGDVGLGNVDNTSDLNKPISTATQTALNSKVDKVAGKGLSTEDYSTAEKSKLAGIAAGAQVNVATDLSLGTATATVLPLNSSTGNDVNLPSATTTTAGLLSATDKTKLNGLSNYVKPVNEPISYITGLQTALDGKASTTYVDGKFTDLIGAAPAALDTLKEIADQLANDESVVSALTTAVSNKANTTDVNTALATKVDKVAGKQLSTEDYTTTDKTKLDGIATGANNYVLPIANPVGIGGIKVSATAQTVAANAVSATASRTYAVQLDASGNALVNVPWVDTNTVYTHPTSGVTAGTYKSVTVDANGHITAGTNPTTLVGYGITDAATSGHSHTDASTTVSGFMSASDKVKLNSLSNYSKPASEPISYIDGLQTALDTRVDKVSKQSLDSNSALRVSGTTVSLYKGDGTFDSITTQDTIYTHPNSGVTAGTYSKVTVNTQGHITAGASLSESDIPNLDASKITTGTIDSARLPSFVDDVLEFVNLAGFPITGETGKIYVALDTNKAYRWSGSTYIYITSGAVDSVAGKTGIVTLVKGDVGLGNVDNTSDLNKPISTATQNALNLKVDKVAGKQLSTEDYTTAEKTKLTGLSNYTKPVSEPISYITGLQTALDSKVSKTGVEALHSTDALRISGTTLSLYKGDGTFESVVTQDTVYTLPKASATTLGGIKVGSNLSIDANGVLNASAASSISWTTITDKPTNISGYGITDAYTKTEVGTLAEFTTNLG